MTMTTIPNYASSTTANPRKPKFNVRLLVFVIAISAPFLYIVGSAIYDSATGGIRNHGDYKEVDLKLLGSFQFDDQAGKVTDVPEQYRQLDGQKVLLRGFMYGADTAADRGHRFQFVYNVTKCCFSGPPLVQERVFATAKRDIPIYYSDTLAEVMGTLHVRLVKDEKSGKIVSVFDLDVDSAKVVGS